MVGKQGSKVDGKEGSWGHLRLDGERRVWRWESESTRVVDREIMTTTMMMMVVVVVAVAVVTAANVYQSPLLCQTINL